MHQQFDPDVCMKSSWQNIQSPFRQIFIKQKYAESKCMELWTVLTACYVDNTLTTWTIHWLHWHYIDYVDTTLTTWTIHGQYIDYIDTTLTLHWVHWHYIEYIDITLTTLTLCLLHWHYICYIDTTLATLTLHLLHWHYICYIDTTLSCLSPNLRPLPFDFRPPCNSSPLTSARRASFILFLLFNTF